MKNDRFTVAIGSGQRKTKTADVCVITITDDTYLLFRRPTSLVLALIPLAPEHPQVVVVPVEATFADHYQNDDLVRVITNTIDECGDQPTFCLVEIERKLGQLGQSEPKKEPARA